MTNRSLHTALLLLACLATRGTAQEGTQTNFDFVPGSRVLFAEDFARDRVGNFPKRLQLIVGNMEVVEVGGKRFLRSTSDPASVRIMLPEILPKRFTLEFDVYAPHLGVTVVTDTKDMEEKNWADACTSSSWEDAATSVLCFSQGSAAIAGGGVRMSSKEQQRDTTFRARMHVDGEYIKAYIDQDRVVNHPSANFGRSKSILINLPATADTPTLIGNFLIAAGGNSMYDALTSDGQVATQGIYFDVGSDQIRAESGPTLALISDMLKEHPELKLTVEGHTDNTGAAAANLTLSEKRAQAIVKHLVANGTSAARLASKGMGASKPAASNETPEGRQQNRRVVLVKM